MNEQLVVKNFGPIQNATVDFKRVTVFIGPTGGGKSTLAKLAAVFRDEAISHDITEREFGESVKRLLEEYGIFNYYNATNSAVHWESSLKRAALHGPTVSSSNLLSGHIKNLLSEKITYVSNYCKVRLRKGESLGSFDYLERIYQALPVGIDWEFQILRSNIFPDPVYIPAERAFASAIEESLFKLKKIRVELPKPLENFMQAFEQARQEVHFFNIPFLDTKYSYTNSENRLQIGNKNVIKLKEGASGLQSVLPMLLVVDYFLKEGLTKSFIVEEPELNLYPTAQNRLLNTLVEKCTKGENDLTITTHSPYILSSCNLLLEAYKVAQQRPELADEIDKIVPRACWLNPEEFAAYYVADGTVKPITDDRTHLVGSNELDAISGDISDSFRQLLRLQKQKPTAI